MPVFPLEKTNSHSKTGGFADDAPKRCVVKTSAQVVFLKLEDDATAKCQVTREMVI